MSNYVRVSGSDFIHQGKKIRLRGYGLGNWMNIEHFMLGMPGTEKQIRLALENAFGADNIDRFWDAYLQNMADEDDFKFLKSIGVNALRIPINYRHFEQDAKPFEYKKTAFYHLDRIMKLCKQYGIFAILDLHAAPGGQNPDWHCDNEYGEALLWDYADFRKRTVHLWKHIARHFKDNPYVLGYDLLNEPVIAETKTDLLVAFYNELIRAIREEDPNHVLFIEGNFYGTRFEMFQGFRDKNIALSFHFYPMIFANNFRGKDRKEKLEEAILKNCSGTYIKEQLNLPIWCGETGIRLTGHDQKFDVQLLTEYLEILEKLNISWSLWTYKDSRAMGTLRPKEDSKWMSFIKNASAGWNFWKEWEEGFREAERYMRKFGSENATDAEKRRIAFRAMASSNLSAVRRYKDLFKRTQISTLVELTEDLKFSKCEQWKPLIELVCKFTGMPVPESQPESKRNNY